MDETHPFLGHVLQLEEVCLKLALGHQVHELFAVALGVCAPAVLVALVVPQQPVNEYLVDVSNLGVGYVSLQLEEEHIEFLVLPKVRQPEEHVVRVLAVEEHDEGKNREDDGRDYQVGQERAGNCVELDSVKYGGNDAEPNEGALLEESGYHDPPVVHVEELPAGIEEQVEKSDVCALEDKKDPLVKEVYIKRYSDAYL